MVRTHVILDGLADPRRGQALSARWAQAGFDNQLDVAGQSASLTLRDGAAMTEAEVDRAATIARMFGLELRDRASESFMAANNLAAMHQRLAYEYRARLATGLMFGLPAIGLHYVAPLLAVGGDGARTMFFPWLFELLLVGWMCIAAGWPILWQGGLALRSLRATPDFLTTLLIVVAFVPSAIGLLGMLMGHAPFYGLAGPTFHVAAIAVLIALAQRWLMYRNIDRLAGLGMLMLVRFSAVVGAWVVVAGVVWLLVGWKPALALALLLPPMASHGAINPWSPGWTSILPTFAFALLFLINPIIHGLTLEPVRLEVAGGFALLQTLIMAIGWHKIAAHRVDS